MLGFLADPTPATSIGGRRFRVYYATHKGDRAVPFLLFCDRGEKLSESYRRYLEAGLVEEFDLKGCPIYFDLVGKEREETRTRPQGSGPEEHRPKWQQAEERGKLEE